MLILLFFKHFYDFLLPIDFFDATLRWFNNLCILFWTNLGSESNLSWPVLVFWMNHRFFNRLILSFDLILYRLWVELLVRLAWIFFNQNLVVNKYFLADGCFIWLLNDDFCLV